VYAIAHSWPPRRVALLADTPLPLLVGLAVLAAGAGVLTMTGSVPMTPARAVAAGAAQGGLLATAAAWTANHESRGAPALAATVVLIGAVGAALLPFGATAYLAAPLWLWRQRAALERLGLARGQTGFVIAGAALGAVLGGHLLVTASLTLHYAARRPTLDHLALWLAYDVGANVLTTEAFVRGALFDRAQRRWPFAGAAAFAVGTPFASAAVSPGPSGSTGARAVGAARAAGGSTFSGVPLTLRPEDGGGSASCAGALAVAAAPRSIPATQPHLRRSALIRPLSFGKK
jgi:hypothetical protein